MKRLSRVEIHEIFGEVLGMDAVIEMNLDINTIESVRDTMQELKNEQVNAHYNSTGIIIDGVKYESMIEASRQLNVSRENLNAYISGRNKFYVGSLGDITQIIYKGQVINAIEPEKGNYMRSECIVNGETFKSAREAVKRYGVAVQNYIRAGRISTKGKAGIHTITYKGVTLTA